MSETKFRIGGVYRNGHGSVIRVVREEDGFLKAEMSDGYEFAFDFNPQTGEYMLSPGRVSDQDGLHLLPGELHQVNGEWVPVAEEAPKPAEEQEFCDRLALDAAADLANAAMIARDGPAKQLMPCTCGIPVTGVIHRLDGPCYQAEPKSTAKPALDGLTRIGAMSHMLGSAFLKG